MLTFVAEAVDGQHFPWRINGGEALKKHDCSQVLSIAAKRVLLVQIGVACLASGSIAATVTVDCSSDRLRSAIDENAGVAIRCSVLSSVDGRLGGLRGETGARSIDPSCVDSILP